MRYLKPWYGKLMHGSTHHLPPQQNASDKTRSHVVSAPLTPTPHTPARPTRSVKQNANMFTADASTYQPIRTKSMIALDESYHPTQHPINKLWDPANEEASKNPGQATMEAPG